MRIPLLKRAGFVTAIFCAALSVSCSKSVDERLLDYQAKLEPHVHFIFSAPELGGDAETRADRQRVRDIHKIAALVELYREKTGHYPLGDSASGLRNVTLRDPASPYGPVQFDEHNADPENLKKALETALGPVTLPTDHHDPASGKFMDYNFSLMGGHYAVATYLSHQPHYAEEVSEGEFQYRVGSMENETLPILLFSKLVEGGYDVKPPRRYKRGQ